MATQQSQIDCKGLGEDFKAKVLVITCDEANQAAYHRAELDWRSFERFCGFAGLSFPVVGGDQSGAILYENRRVVSVGDLNKCGLTDVTDDYQLFRTRTVGEAALQSLVNENAKEGYEPHTVSAPQNGRITVIFKRR